MGITKFTAYTIKLKLKNYFIHYYIETLQPRDNFFDILLVFAFFLQTYFGICFFHILSFYFFLLQISFCIYLLLAPLIFLYHFRNNFCSIQYRNIFKIPIATNIPFFRQNSFLTSIPSEVSFLSYSSFLYVACNLHFYTFNSYKVSSRKTCG